MADTAGDGDLLTKTGGHGSAISRNAVVPGQKVVLKDEIEQLLVEYTTYATTKPPFPIEELFVMAGVCSGKSPITGEDALEWIVQTFPYYTQAVLRKHVRVASGREYFHTNSMPDIPEALRHHAIPLVSVHDPATVTFNNHMTVKKYDVPLPAARTFLRHHLEEDRPGVFPFFDLPPELRNCIYMMMLFFDERGFKYNYHRVVNPPGIKVFMQLPSREGDQVPGANDGADMYLSTWVNPGDWMTAPSFAKILGFLQTSKQIRNEAMPYFYSDNRFFFNTANDFAFAINSLETDRFKHLSDIHIKFEWPYEYPQDLPRALQRLATVENLRRLQLDFSTDDVWLKMEAKERRKMGVNRLRKFIRIDQIPIMVQLAFAASHADTLVITGQCTLIDGYITGEVARLKLLKSAMVAGAGLKAVDDTKRGSGGFGSSGSRKRNKGQG
ncbi:hypothetical protein LTR56_000329 [Elasticomyces elasticus]|nr:hypothetical protein LTR56_000329 [Elasticomyces elasticus]KAK4933321.1 hypothetical protein LTR49_000315 [Elasticomyces elasticus]